MAEQFDLSQALAEAEEKAATNGDAAKKSINLSRLAAEETPEKRKLFQNKKANIAIGVTFGVIVLLFAALMVIPYFLH